MRNLKLKKQPSKNMYGKDLDGLSNSSSRRESRDMDFQAMNLENLEN